MNVIQNLIKHEDASLFNIGRVILYAAEKAPIDIRELKHRIVLHYTRGNLLSYKTIKKVHKDINYILSLYIEEELLIHRNDTYYITPKGIYMKSISDQYVS